MQEIWKDIKGYEGLYQVSNLGRVKSLKRIVKLKLGNQYKDFYIDRIINEKILKYSLTPYPQVILSNKAYKIHKLVAETFIPNPNNYPIINHKDGNKLNNSVDNLEWCTYSYNNKEAYRLGLNKPRKKY